MIQITFAGSAHDMARYLAFRAQDLWPEARAFCPTRLDFFGVQDLYFPTTYNLLAQPDLASDSLAVREVLEVSCWDGQAHLTVHSAGKYSRDPQLDGALSTSQGVLDYLTAIPVWQIVRADKEVSHVGA